MSDLATLAQTIIAALPAADAAVASVASYAPIGKGIAFGVAAGGAGIGIGLVFAATIQGVARQPEQAGTLRGLMFLGFALIEALALLGFVMNYLIAG